MQDHVEMISILQKVKELRIGTVEAKQELFQVKDMLLNHLSKEDEQLYPVLKKAAKSDNSLAKKLNTFAKDLEEISGFVINFFEKSDDRASMEFARGFGKLFVTLNKRIQREEIILYPQYNKYIEE